MVYRREIDGLRAVAVLAVVLFHANVSAASGGFVGVDVFFVISGYLITLLIVTEKHQGSFSLMRFFERRARRILPALFAVTVACIVMGWLWMLPPDFKRLSQAVAATMAFASNVLFWLTSGYNDPGTELNPLLHTWSLAVEEQYYLLYPLMLAAALKMARRSVLAMLILLAAASFAMAQWFSASESHARFAFYMLPTRAWELLLGAVCALLATSGRVRRMRPIGSQIAAAAGLSLIVLAIIGFDRATPTPGVHTLVPTAGAALILLFANDRTLTGRVLGHRVLVALGLISYGTFLWHQPLFAFARYKTVDEPGVATMASLVLMSLALGYLSWRWLETPVRSGRWLNRSQVFGWSLAGSACLALLGIAGHISDGFAARRPPSHLPPDYFAASMGVRFSGAKGEGKFCPPVPSVCDLGTIPGARRILLVGDSHSADYAAEFRSYASQRNLSASQLSTRGCGFLPSQDPLPGGECAQYRRALDEFLAANPVAMVVFVVNLYGHTALRSDASVSADLAALTNLLASMGRSTGEVWIFVPRYGLSADPMRAAMNQQLSQVRVALESSRSRVDQSLGSLPAGAGLLLFNERDHLVALGGVGLENFTGHSSAGLALYRDTSHLTAYGARLAFEQFRATREKSAIEQFRSSSPTQR